MQCRHRGNRKRERRMACIEKEMKSRHGIMGGMRPGGWSSLMENVARCKRDDFQLKCCSAFPHTPLHVCSMRGLTLVKHCAQSELWQNRVHQKSKVPTACTHKTTRKLITSCLSATSFRLFLRMRQIRKTFMWKKISSLFSAHLLHLVTLLTLCRIQFSKSKSLHAGNLLW